LNIHQAPTDRIWRPSVTVAAVIEHEGRFLMVQERQDGRAVYNQPAGHLEHGESLRDAVIRETLEETTGVLRPTAVIGVYRWIEPNSGRTYLRVCFTGRCTHFDTGRTLAPEIMRTVWMSRADLDSAADDMRSPLVMRCIEDYLRGERHPLSLLADLTGT
jgi:phosphatase NudJ